MLKSLGAGGQLTVEQLAVEFHRTSLAPDRGGAPLVASLWTEGRYEGSQAARIRDLAAAASVEFHREVVRGAPIDHLGVILHLWAATAHRRWRPSPGWPSAATPRVQAPSTVRAT